MSRKLVKRGCGKRELTVGQKKRLGAALSRKTASNKIIKVAFLLETFRMKRVTCSTKRFRKCTVTHAKPVLKGSKLCAKAK